MLHYSAMTIRRMIADGTLVAWKPRGPRGRKWLIDEISLGALQAAMVKAARTKAAPIQSALLQGELPLARLPRGLLRQGGAQVRGWS